MDSDEVGARLAIQDTIVRYSESIDAEQWENVGRLFASQGELIVPGNRVVGPAGVTEYLSGRYARAAASFGPFDPFAIHMISSMLIDIVGPSSATARSHFLTLTRTCLDHWGTYDDELVPVDGAWRFQKRVVAVEGYSSESLFALQRDDQTGRPDALLMDLDPEVRVVLDARAALQLPELHTLSIEQARGLSATAMSARAHTTPVGRVDDRTIPGAAGPLPIRVYHPVADRPNLVVIFFHGSGWALGGLDSHDEFCRLLCLGAGAVVIAVDYRLAPEHRFPAASDDCLAATRWIGAHAADFDVADHAAVVLAGDSAGGNLAAVTAIRVRDEGGPAVCGQLLLYPATDHHSAGHPSYDENGTDFGLSASALRWYWGLYLADEADAADPRASPLRAKSLADLPPAFVLTAGYDPLRDEGVRYAERLSAAGVHTEHVRFDDQTHGFMLLTTRRSAAARAAACEWLRRRIPTE